MGSRASVTVFYGICYDAENEDAEKFEYGTTDPPKSETHPAALSYWGHSGEGVEVVTYGHHDYGRYALQLEPPPPIFHKGRADALLKAYCEKHGLTWREPQWWAVPYYG